MNKLLVLEQLINNTRGCGWSQLEKDSMPFFLFCIVPKAVFQAWVNKMLLVALKPYADAVPASPPPIAKIYS